MNRAQRGAEAGGGTGIRAFGRCCVCRSEGALSLMRLGSDGGGEFTERRSDAEAAWGIESEFVVPAS